MSQRSAVFPAGIEKWTGGAEKQNTTAEESDEDEATAAGINGTTGINGANGTNDNTVVVLLCSSANVVTLGPVGNRLGRRSGILSREYTHPPHPTIADV